MKVGIIGSGGREHAICKSIVKSIKIEKVFCFPGNAGTADIAENIKLDLENFENIKNFVLENKINLVIVGPEKPLVEGLVDYLEKFNIKVFGPNKIASQLEGSKIFTKKLCEKFNIPTAKFGIFKTKIDARKFINNSNYPIVIKADNLASGKGVYICNNENEANSAIEEIFNGKFGKAENLLIEEFLEGEEMSFFIISDGKNIKTFETAQDHKRVLEGDKGKNTGGMGAYSPSRLINPELENRIIKKIINPTLKGLSELGCEYKGFLYAGLMIINNEPYLIEYNVRMGDPECQTILPRLETSFFEIVDATVNEKLEKLDLKWQDSKTISIVLCSKGYPETYEINKEIKNLDKVKLNNSEFIFHAGTKVHKSKIISNGGRVLNFVAKSKSFRESREIAVNLINKIDWKDGFYRGDIGFRVID